MSDCPLSDSNLFVSLQTPNTTLPTFLSEVISTNYVLTAIFSPVSTRLIYNLSILSNMFWNIILLISAPL